MGLRDRVFAAVYDSLNEPLQKLFGPYRERTAGQARGRVLEIGAGTGANLPYYSREVRLMAVELNPHMAKRLAAQARKQGREVEVVQEVAESLPFEDDSFDGVVSTTVLCSVTDVSKALSEIRRVLKPGGAFYFHEHVAAEGGWVRKVQDWGTPIQSYFAGGCHMNRDLGSGIRAAGFSRVEMEEFRLPKVPAWEGQSIVGTAWK